MTHETTSARRETEPAASQAAVGAHILIVDDEWATRHTLASLLKRTGYRVEEADSGRVALEHIKRQHFDLVILDLKMPEMDGTEVLRAASAHKGSALIEIYQNCPIFNDGAFDTVKDSETKEGALLHLVHGQPIKSATHGLVHDGSSLKLVELGSVAESDLVVHDVHNQDASYAFALSRFSNSKLDHVPVGIFRDVERAEYGSQVNGQISDIIAAQGAGDLETLLTSGDTWTVA